MAKEPATAIGMTLRLTSVAAFIIVVGHFWVVPTVSIKVWTIITLAGLTPSVTLAIFQQIRLRRALVRKKDS